MAGSDHVQVADVSIGYRVVGRPGRGTPLLLIMGSSGTMEMWSPALVAALAAARQVVVFDNRGMGETANPKNAYDFSQLADDAAGLIRALGHQSMDVLGWSMGGKVAIDLAVRHPEAVRRVVSYAGDAGGSLAVPPTDEALAVLLDTEAAPEERGMRLLELLFPAEFRAAHPDYYRLLPMPGGEMDPAQIGMQSQAIAEWPGVWDGLSGISKPILFVTGGQDLITPPRNAEMMAERVAGSSLIAFPDSGHGLMYQESAALADAVCALLDAA